MKNNKNIRSAQYNKGIAPVIIALIVAVVLGGGYLIVKQSEKNSPNTNQTAQPSITVTSPNGGETWAVGSTHNITWTTQGLPSSDTVNIMLLSYDQNSKNPSGEMLNGNINTPKNAFTSANSDSYSWTIPSTIPTGNNYKIGVNANSTGSVNSNGYTVRGLSTNYFSIVAATNQTTGWKTYTNTKYGFSIQYPADLVNADLGARGYYDHGVDPNFTVLKRFEMPGSQNSGNEKIAGLIQISIATKSDAVSSCLTYRSPDEATNMYATTSTTDATINGIQFKKFEGSEGDLGNRFGERVFTTVKNNICYKIEINESGVGFAVGPNVSQQTSLAEAKKYGFPFSAYDVFAKLTPVALTFKFAK